MTYFHFHCVSVWYCKVFAYECRYSQRPEVNYPGAGVTGNCVFPSMCPRSWIWVFCSTLNHWAVTQALLLLNFSLSENPVDSTFRMSRIWSFLFTLVQGMLSYFVSYVCLSGCVDGRVCKYVIEEARGWWQVSFLISFPLCFLRWVLFVSWIDWLTS